MTASGEQADGLTSGRAAFRPRARLIRLIGSELISDEIMAVVELVKNAYDADARSVTVELANIHDPRAATLSVTDDGEGMDLDTVLHSWLEPATNHKRRGGRKLRTPLGRYPLGEKGVGRFAADKLGDRMELVTRGAGDETEIVLSVAWDHFGDTGYLDEIEIDWVQRRPVVFEHQPRGSRIEAGALRGEWDSARLIRLREGLSRLVSPSSDNLDFRIILQCPDYPELEGEITNGLVSRAPYQLAGIIDAVGVLREEGSNEPVDLRLLAGDHFFAETGRREAECGPVRFAFYAWDLDVQTAGRIGLDRGTRAQLRRISGVSIYRDGFRVWPYGSPGDDWLELNQRRVNNPTLRLSTNQLVGVVEVTQDANPKLIDRTSREGLIDNKAVQDLRALLVAALSLIEEHRFANRQSAGTTLSEHEETDPLLRVLSDLRGRPDAATGNRQLIDQAIAEYRRQAEQQRATTQRLIRLAGIASSVEQVVSEIRRTIGVTSTGLELARTRADSSDTPDEIRTFVRRIDDQMGFLGRQLDVVEDLAAWDNAFSPPLTDLRNLFRDVETLFAFRLRNGSVRFEVEQASGVSSSLPRRELLQILVHLFENAIHWVCYSGNPSREIRVRLTEDPAGFILADSGPGIDKAARNQVFDLHYSRRADGRGLGLYLVQSILATRGGSIEVLPEPVLLPGANLQVKLPRG